MKQATHFVVQPGWKVLLTDMGLNPADVLKLAGLPTDLFARNDATLNVADYFKIWAALEQLAGEQHLPLLIGQAISAESFDPPIFASFCSPDFNTAMLRLSHYKRLVGPMMLEVDITKQHTKVSIDCYQHQGELPGSIAASELVFMTQLIRMATRQPIIPDRVTLKNLPDDHTPLKTFFGTNLTQGDIASVWFSQEDAKRPFLTENTGMWEFFEPELQKRLSNLDAEASTSQRVKSLLLEMLPSGESTMEQAANRLAVSKRTLQRRLNDESTSYQEILKSTREELAQHYLKNSSLSQGEISFLLGFQDTNSFIRAYSQWTGKPPGQFRLQAI